MIQAFAEAVRATAQPCTLLLLLPPISMAVITRGRWIPFAAMCVGAVLGGWIFIANVVALSDFQLQLSGVLVAFAIGVTLVAPELVPAPRTARWIEATAAGATTLVATLWWRPCVGSQLGAILTAARSGVAAQLPGITAYMLGAMVPVLVVVLVLRAADPAPTASSRLATAGALGGLIVAGAMATGRHDDLVSALTRWTNA